MAVEPTTATNPMGKYSDSIAKLKRNQTSHDEERVRNGIVIVEPDHETIRAAQKKWGDSSGGFSDMAFEDWMKLLCASFQNQDPMNTKDPGSVSAEIAGMASANVLGEVNKKMEGMSDLMKQGQSMSTGSRIGKTVEIEHNGFRFDGDKPVKLGFDIPAATKKIEISILDKKGKEVAKLNREHHGEIIVDGKPKTTFIELGRNEMTWDGMLKNLDQKAQRGTYFFQVDAFDSDGNLIKDYHTGESYNIKQYVQGTLENSYMDENKQHKVVVDGMEVSYDSVKKYLYKDKTSDSTPAPAPTNTPPTAPQQPQPAKSAGEQKWENAVDKVYNKFKGNKETNYPTADDIKSTINRFNLG